MRQKINSSAGPTITIFSASVMPDDKQIIREVGYCGKFLAKHGFKIKQGGGENCLMSVISEAAIKNGGMVTSVSMKGWTDHEFYTDRITLLDLQSRQDFLIKNSDAFIVFPGGVGTLLEVYDVMTRIKMKEINSPIILYSNFFDMQVDHIMNVKNQMYTPEYVVDKVLYSVNMISLKYKIKKLFPYNFLIHR